MFGANAFGWPYFGQVYPSGVTYIKSGIVISSAVAGGVDQFASTETGIAVSAASILRGVDQFIASETGITVAALALDGGEQKILNRSGIVAFDLDMIGQTGGIKVKYGAGISSFVLKGSDQKIFGRASIVISPLVLGGSSDMAYSRAGSVIFVFALTSTAAVEKVKTGIVVTDSDFSAVSRLISQLIVKVGHARSSLELHGIDNTVHGRKNIVISALLARASDESVHAETGKAISSAVLSGARLRLKSRSGRVESIFALRGADTASHSRSGAVISARVARGTAQRLHARAGMVISAFSALGKKLSIKPPKSGTVVVNNAKLSGIKLRLVPKAGKAIVISSARAGRQHTVVRASAVKMEAVAKGVWAIDLTDLGLFENTLLGVIVEAPELLDAQEPGEAILITSKGTATLLDAQTSGR